MSGLGPLGCPCEGAFLRCHFVYDAPPSGEVRFSFSSAGPYRREVRRCGACHHFVSVHEMDQSRLYEGDYVTSNYGDDGIAHAFERVISLEPSRSDNAGRARRVQAFAASWWPSGGRRSLLDIGSGIGVFVHAMKAAGFDCTALDPDERAVRHARERVGVTAVHGDFMRISPLGRFDVVTLNKVLEHVADPLAMLEKAAGAVASDGFVYVEVPDGEVAAAAGREREEFFIDHRHVFSLPSVCMLANRSGLRPVEIERLTEPSGKFTIRAFLAGPGS